MASNPNNENKPYSKSTDQKPGKPSKVIFNDYSDTLANHLGLYLDIYAMHAQKRVAFKAFLTQFQDSFDTGLDTVFFVGHHEPLRKMKSVDRQIQLGLDLIASNANQAKQNLHDLSTLVKMIYPVMDQSSDNVLTHRKHVKTGGDPIFKIKFKNLLVGASANPVGPAKLDGLKGYIGNINYTFDMASGFHNDIGNDAFLYPQLIKLAFSFYPFNEISPGWTKEDDAPGGDKYSFKRKNYPYANAGLGSMIPASWSPRHDEGWVNNRAVKAGIEKALGGGE